MEAAISVGWTPFLSLSIVTGVLLYIVVVKVKEFLVSFVQKYAERGQVYEVLV